MQIEFDLIQDLRLDSPPILIPDWNLDLNIDLPSELIFDLIELILLTPQYRVDLSLEILHFSICALT